MFLRSTLPDLTVCPQCGNADRSTFCRYCKVSKIAEVAAPPLVPVIVDQDFESDLGCIKVCFRGQLDARSLRVCAVIAPPDPEVGIFEPYPVECQALDDSGAPVQLSYPQARFLASRVSHQLF